MLRTRVRAREQTKGPLRINVMPGGKELGHGGEATAHEALARVERVVEVENDPAAAAPPADGQLTFTRSRPRCRRPRLRGPHGHPQPLNPGNVSETHGILFLCRSRGGFECHVCVGVRPHEGFGHGGHRTVMGAAAKSNEHAIAEVVVDADGQRAGSPGRLHP